MKEELNTFETQVRQPGTNSEVLTVDTALEKLETLVVAEESKVLKDNQEAEERIVKYSGATQPDVNAVKSATTEAFTEIEEVKQDSEKVIAELKGTEDPNLENEQKKSQAKAKTEELSQKLVTLNPEQVQAFLSEHQEGDLQTQEFQLLKSENGQLVMVNESGKLQQLSVSKENAKSVLQEIKSKDETIKGPSYKLRKEVLKLSAGTIMTYEAYTYANQIPQGGNLDAYLDNPDNWLPERLDFQKGIISGECEKAFALSKRLQDSEPTIYALRGNTASGKSTAIKSNELFKKSLDENGQATGAINPDTYKTAIKAIEADAGRQTVGHDQAHEEGSTIARKITQEVLNSEASMVIDKRMNKEKNILELVKMAQETGKVIRILDVDVPLQTSLIRVLGRAIGGVDPNVPFGAVVEGFEGIRTNRVSLLQQVRDNPKIKDYVLYGMDENGDSVKMAEKTNGAFMVIEEQMENLKKILKENPQTEIETLGKTVIDESYIQGIMDKTPDGQKEKVQTSLQRYTGKTLQQALNEHALKLNED